MILRAVFCVVALAGVFGAASLLRAADEKTDGWVSLFNGTDMAGWKLRNPGAKKTWAVFADARLQVDNEKQLEGLGVGVAGHGTMVNGDDGRGSDIMTEKHFGDCELSLEFMMARGSNSGVYVMGLYEVQLFDSFGKRDEDLKTLDVGAIYDHRPPATNASKTPGQWQTLEIVFRAPRFDAAGKKTEPARFVSVKLNGKEVQKDVELNGPTTASLGGPEKALGPILLQGDHGPVAYRNLRIR